MGALAPRGGCHACPAWHWAPGRTAGHGAGAGGWARTGLGGHPGDLPLHGAQRSTPPRHEVRNVSSAARPEPAPGGTRGGPAAGGRLVTVLRTPRAGRGAHLYSSLEPLEVPWPASTSYRVPHGGLLRGSSHPTPTPAPGKLPCDPNWPLQPVITAPVWFFFSGGRKFRLHRDDLFSVCSFLRSRKLPRPGGRRSS